MRFLLPAFFLLFLSLLPGQSCAQPLQRLNRQLFLFRVVHGHGDSSPVPVINIHGKPLLYRVKTSFTAAHRPGQNQRLPSFCLPEPALLPFQHGKKLPVIPYYHFTNLFPGQISLSGNLAFRLPAHRQPSVLRGLRLVQIKFQLHHICPAAVHPPGRLLLLIISRRAPADSLIKDRAHIGPGIPSFLLCLQKIIALSRVSCLALKASSPYGCQMKTGYRRIGVPEGTGQSTELFRLFHLLQRNSPGIQTQKPGKKALRAEGSRPLKVLSVLGSGAPEDRLKIRKTGPMADDSQTLHALLRLRRQTGKACQQLEREPRLHGACGLGKLFQIPFPGFFPSVFQLLPRKRPLLQLKCQNCLGLVYAQFPAVAAAGGMLQGA